MRIRAIALVLLLSACVPEDQTERLDPTPAQAAEAACVADGGDWTTRGTARMFCERQTGDGGASCRFATDCEGLCLARSRTCSPVTPLLGCNEVLGANGAASTLCVE